MPVTLILASLVLGTPKSCCGNMAMLGNDPAFLAAHLSPKPLKFQATTGSTVTFPTPDGHQGSGFFVPAKAPGKPAILMFHEYWGLNDYIRREAERLQARTGYAVLAVDLYDGKVATESPEAVKLMQSVKDSEGDDLVHGALNALHGTLAGYPVKKIGTIGWCFGGSWSFRTALIAGKQVRASVVYYGMPETDPAKLASLSAPVLMFWGKRDQWISTQVVEKFQSAAKVAGKSVEAHGYDDGHAFANPSNPGYDQAASTEAMNRSVAFFAKHLGK